MSVSDIEEEMRKIYEIELSTSAISIITNKAWNIFPDKTKRTKMDLSRSNDLFNFAAVLLKLHFYTTN